jgi:predicted TIM-barrel fold metal-dependent hydrolase
MFIKRAAGILAIGISVFLVNCVTRNAQGGDVNRDQQALAAPVERQPIIDAHAHAFHAPRPGEEKWTWPEWLPAGFLSAPATDEALRQETLDIFKRYHVVKAVVSGSLLDEWRKAAPDVVVPGFTTGIAGTTPEQFAALRKDFAAGRLAVIGEVVSQYRGLIPNDPRFEPFFALAEELDKPMSVHVGLGAPGSHEFRMGLGHPLFFEDALVRHPKLRLCVCHAGYPFLEEMIALLYYYPQVYVDVAFIDWYLPRREFQTYLRRLVDAGYSKRIMFGSDNIYWPGSIPLAIDSIESADYLTSEQKRDILYNNAERFFRLEIKRP